MNENVRPLEQLVERYLGGGQPFWEFWRVFMDEWVTVELDGQEHDKWFEAYELVYMAQPDPVDPGDRIGGILGERELKEQLREFLGRLHEG